jgi:hypothetical protein
LVPRKYEKYLTHIQTRINFLELISRKVSYAVHVYRDSEYCMIGIFFNIGLSFVKRGKIFGLLQVKFICSLLGLFVKALIMLTITGTVL